MEGWIAWLLGSKIGLGALSLGLGGLLMVGKRVIPGLVQKLAGGYLARLLDPHTDDPKERELLKAVVVALVRYAEYKIPDRGQGKERYLLVATRLAAMIPALRGHEARISELVEEGVAAMDAELKKAA